MLELEKYSEEFKKMYEEIPETSNLWKLIEKHPRMIEEVGGYMGVIIYLFKYVENLKELKVKIC